MSDKQTQIEAATFRRLLTHLDDNKDVQNIDLMILAKFCRNCLSKWMVEEAKNLNQELELDEARKAVYKMDYSEWKDKYQTEVSQEKMELFNQTKK